MSITASIKQNKKKIEDLTIALKRALTVEMGRIDEEGITGYSYDHDETNHKFTVLKAGNTARFVIDLERYIQASLLHTEAVEAFIMYSGTKENYHVHIPKTELHRLHRSFTTEIQEMVDNFVVFVETDCLGEAE